MNDDRSTWMLLGLATVLSVAAAWTVAHPWPVAHPTVSGAWISRLDLDADGVLTAEEAARQARPGAPSWDLDGDGQVQAGELELALSTVDPTWLIRRAADRNL